MSADTHEERVKRAQIMVDIATRELQRAHEERRRVMAAAALSGNTLKRIARWADMDHSQVSREVRSLGIRKAGGHKPRRAG